MNQFRSRSLLSCFIITALMISVAMYKTSDNPSIQSLLATFTSPTNRGPSTPTQCRVPVPKSESPCLSRKESPSYSRHSPYKPSPYLLSKLRSYEDLHQRCGPYTAAYNRTVMVLEKQVNASSTSFTTECSYVVYIPDYGLGNRIITLTSTFLYALLTDRVLLVNFESDMTGLFCEPFPHSSWIMPGDFPGKDVGFESHETFQSILARCYKSQNDNVAGLVESVTLPSISHVNLRSGPRPRKYNLKFFHCNEGHHLLNKIPVLSMVSDLYFIPSLFMTPLFTEELDKMIPQKEAVFHHLVRYLFYPSDEAWELIKNFYDANMAMADEKVGLQIRVFHPQAGTQEEVMNHILACTQEHNILPKVDSKLNETTNSSSSPSSAKPLVNAYKSVMVASLYPDYAKNLTRMFGPSRPTPYGEVIEIHQASHEGKQKSSNMRHNLQAWVEMYLLSLCDRLVTSSSSTFGYVAQGLGGLKPWVLLDNYMRKRSNSVCIRAGTIDPCFHAPPKFDCMTGKNVRSLSKVFSFIKNCEDRPYDGIRLSDD